MTLEGTFETFSVMDVVAWLQQLIRVGRLDAHGPNGLVHLWIADGGIVGAESAALGDEISPALAVFEILRAGPAEWQFISGDQATSKIEHAPVGVMSLVGELEKMVTEWAELLDVVPSVEAAVRLVIDITAPIVVNDDRWAMVLLLAQGPVSVGELVESIGVHDLAGRRRIADLVEAGIATVDGGAPRRVIDLTEAAATSDAHVTDSEVTADTEADAEAADQASA